MDKVLTGIDVSTPRGRKMIRDLDTKECVSIETTLPKDIVGQTYSEDEVWEMVENRMSEHYGVKINIR